MPDGARSNAQRLGVAALIVGLAVVLYFAKVREGMADFEVYRRAAGRAVAAENLYRPEDGHYQYKYFPLFAIVMAPLSWVDQTTARAAWYAFSFVLLYLFVRGAIRRLPNPRLSRRALGWLTVLFVGKYYARELFLGQTNLLFAMTLLGALSAIAAGARKTAGVCAALAVFVKPYGLILLPWLAVAAGLPGLLAFTAVLAAGLFAPALVYGWSGNLQQLHGWYRTVTDTSAPNLLKEENISFATAWAKWLGQGPGATHLAIVTGLVAIAVAAWVLARRQSVKSPSYLEVGLLMMLVPVLSPQGWDYLLLLATPAILCLLDRWRETTLVWRGIAAAGLALMSFTIFDLMGRSLYGDAMRLSVDTIAVMVTAACVTNLRLMALA